MGVFDPGTAASVRDQRILDRSSLVRTVANSVRIQHGLFAIPFDDLVCAGQIGLIQAVDRYDQSREDTFDAYAWMWIRGAILSAVADLFPGSAPVDDLIITSPAADPGRRIDLSSLTPKQAATVRFRLDGLTQENAARALGVSRQAAQRLEERAIRTLRRRAASTTKKRKYYLAA